MSDDVDLGGKLDELAAAMIKAANEDGVKLSEKMEVFKTVSNHYVNVSKVKGKHKTPPNDGNGPTMGALRNSIDQAGKSEEKDEDDEPTDAR